MKARMANILQEMLVAVWGAIEQSEVTHGLKYFRIEGSSFESFNFPQDVPKQIFSC